jgi:hypothetical protein
MPMMGAQITFSLRQHRRAALDAALRVRCDVPTVRPLRRHRGLSFPL